jgi:CheY-like chemotaxis protein
MMPGMNGWELIRHLKADSRYADIPVVVVSAAVRVGEIPGVVCFLRKPLNLEELLATLEQHLGVPRRP